MKEYKPYTIEQKLEYFGNKLAQVETRKKIILNRMKELQALLDIGFTDYENGEQNWNSQLQKELNSKTKKTRKKRRKA